MPISELFDGATAASFGISVDGVTIKSIKECQGLKWEVDMIEIKQNTFDGKYVIKKVAGRQKSGNITLTRTMTEDLNFKKWCEAARFGKMKDARKTAEVVVFDTENAPLRKFKLLNAWPTTLEVTSMTAGGTNTIDEKLTIHYEELQMM